MKNSIFKSYSKKILKSEAFVSVIIVFVLAIGIISTSYALYMDVDKDTDYQLVQVGDLSIGFDKGDNTISLSNMTPSEDDIALKQTDNIFSFYIYNTGTYTADYNIKLVTTDGNEVDKQYINFRICKDNSNNCDDIKTLSDITDDIIYNDELAPKKSGDATNPSSYYFIRIWINNKYTNTTSKNIKLKVVVDASNASGELDNKNTLAGRILNDSRIKINNDTPDMSKIETEEKGLYTAPDDYGTTYYFRGAQTYNYVNFAGMCWRIVRIQGDGSIKLILEDQNTTCESTAYTGNWNLGNANFGYDSSTYSGKYVLNYLNPVTNASSALVNKFKTFQTGTLTTKISSTYSGKGLSDYLKSGDWCLDDTAYASSSSTEGTPLTEEQKTNYYNGTTSGNFYYDSYIRLYGQSTKTPTNKCNGTVMTKFADNTDMYVGTLTADEIVYAGGKVNTSNQNYYLINDYQKTNYLYFWSLSPYYWNGSISRSFYVNNGGNVNGSNVNYDGRGSRPAVSLKSSVLISGGEGTKDNPYTLKLY